MDKQRNAFKAGLFILISIGLTIGVIVGIEGLGSFFEPTQQRTVTFTLTDNLNGLSKGDDVRVGGVKVGKVNQIEYVPEDNGSPRLHVHYQIPKKYVIRKDAVVAIESLITGSAYINIANLGTGDELPDTTSVVGRIGGIGALMAKADDTILAFKDTSLAATAMVKKIDDRIDPVIDKYNALATRGTEMMTALRDMIGQSTTDFKGTMANLNASTTAIKEKLPGILDDARAVLTKLQGTIDNATLAMEDIKKTFAHTRDLTKDVKTIIATNRAKFDAIIAGLKDSSDNIKHATVELRRSPWRLLYKPGPGEVDNLLLFDSAREFADGANDLNDAVQALKDAVNSGDVPPDELQKKIDLLNHSFEKFTGVEQKLWKNVKE